MNEIVQFGLVIPGRPLLCQFLPVAASKAILEIANPGDVPELAFFLLPSSPVPVGSVAALYSSTLDQSWELIGTIRAESPSGFFKTRWDMTLAGASTAQLGVSIEKSEQFSIPSQRVDDRKYFAYKVAHHLFNFMTSFNQSSNAGSEVMVIPTNILDRWLESFNQKYARDPSFLLR
ncbi:unnamed protein product [Chrysoparadoxa australica]